MYIKLVDGPLSSFAFSLPKAIVVIVLSWAQVQMRASYVKENDELDKNIPGRSEKQNSADVGDMR